MKFQTEPLPNFQSGLIGTQNAVITSFKQDNTMNWSTYIGGSKQDYGTAVAFDNANNTYITGYTYSPDLTPVGISPAYTQTFPAGATCNAFIVEVDGSGHELWSTYFGGAGAEAGKGITIDASNNVYIVGQENASVMNASIPTYSVVGAYNSTAGPAWLAEFDPTHAPVWSTCICGSNASATTDKLVACTVDAANNLYVAGTFMEAGFPFGSNFNFVSGTNNGNAFVAKFDAATHNVVWASYYGGDGNNTGFAIVISPDDGNLYLTGSTNSPAVTYSIQVTSNAYQPNLGGTGKTNAFIAGFSGSTGALTYGTYFGGNANMTGYGITYSKGLYICGSGYPNCVPVITNPANTWNWTSPPSPGTEPVGFIAGFPYQSLAINPFPYIWGTYFGGSSSYDRLLGIAATASEQIYVVGNTSSPTDFPVYYGGTPTPWYQTSLAAGGTTNANISEFDLTPVNAVFTAINKVIFGNGINVYPNPTNEDIKVQLQSEKEQDMEFSIYNLFGERVYFSTVKEPEGSITEEIDLSLLSNGTYILEVTRGNIIEHAKISKLQ